MFPRNPNYDALQTVVTLLSLLKSNNLSEAEKKLAREEETKKPKDCDQAEYEDEDTQEKCLHSWCWSAGQTQQSGLLWRLKVCFILELN